MTSTPGPALPPQPAAAASPSAQAAPAGPPPQGPNSAGPAPTSLAPTGRSLWHRSRWYLLSAALLLLAATVLAGLNQDRRYPRLDPRSYDATGTHAVVALLQREGLKVDITEDLTGHPTGNDTLVIPEPDLLTPEQLRTLAAAKHTRLVLLSPGPAALSALVPGVRPSDEGGGAPYAAVRSTAAQCSLPEAVRAGTAHLGGLLYTAGSHGEGCYPRGHGYPLVTLRTGKDAEVVVLGSGDFLTNELVKKDGNASLALGLLGSRPSVTWQLPDYGTLLAESGNRKELGDFVPDGWRWGGYQLAVAVLFAAFWRARRLGPVISENLPVVVRAAETTEGRARLYRRAKARGRAADALRRAAAHRLAPALGVPLDAGVPDPTALCAAVLDRLPDRPAGDVQALLYGPPPTDDAALLRLADDLDALERQVRKP
ncbi:DUF4350 domain-containing protein [Kitasatospora sp. A2-31]|uniref:DUF4350 domain-containing protein n=1 Tax=Kitasatospora sp. A2-31 TaxID=2916414 RepID=UPI001EEA3CB9|nr:DUF4350 domain-containing protein [Kitasatospora sp. A2-31]MCG6496379.1 DUF4350 domain-containing protein [Kitasatospora sp. A2-31]